MDLELLRTFLEVNRSRHFGRAAIALHLTQAAVSSRIKSLESILGAQLFERSRREIRLTGAGQRLVRHAERQISAWRAARQDVALASVGRQLIIGGSLRLWDILLQPWLHRLRSANPDMAIIAESHHTDLLTRRLIDGTLDVALVLEPAQLDILQVEPVSQLEFICVSTFRGLSMEQALDRDYVYVDWGLSHALDHRRAFPDAGEPMTRVSHARIALGYLQDIGGSAFLPAPMIANGLAAGKLHRVAGAPVFLRDAYATYPVRSARMRLIRESLEFL